MEAVKVQYTVWPEFVEENKANIRKVMDRLKSEPIEGVHYSSFTLDDGQTFVHINIMKTAEAKAAMVELPEFKAFQAALKASDPVSPPSAEPMELVAAGFEV